MARNRSGCTCPTYVRLYSSLLGWSTTIVGNGCHVCDRPDYHSRRLQGAYCRLATGARSLDKDIDFTHPIVLGPSGCLLGRQLCRVRCALSGTLEASGARACPGNCIAMGIRKRDDGIVERGLYVRLASRDVSLFPPRPTPRPWSPSCHAASSICSCPWLVAGHRSSAPRRPSGHPDRRPVR